MTGQRREATVTLTVGEIENILSAVHYAFKAKAMGDWTPAALGLLRAGCTKLRLARDAEREKDRR